MKKYFIPAVSAAILLPMVLTSCETPVGQGAGFGAATGAIIGGAATGRVRGAAIGAGAGALAGALIGAAVEEDQRALLPCTSGRLSLRPAYRHPGYVYSPYGSHNVIDVRGVPPGAWVRDPSTGGIFIRP